jgi:hypothetical protein
LRAVFLFLVLVNLAFFAWANFVSEGDNQSDPRPKARQVAPEKLRIVPASAVKPSAEKVSAATGSTKTCLELGGFSLADATRASEALAPLALGARLTQRNVDDGAKWWVFIAPQATRQDAQKKAAELKALGVDDYFIVQDEGLLRHALSLGVFKTEAAAATRLETLRAKGVRSAQHGSRDSQVQKVYFQVRAVDEPLAMKLREIGQSLGSEARACPAATG